MYWYMWYYFIYFCVNSTAMMYNVVTTAKNNHTPPDCPSVVVSSTPTNVYSLARSTIHQGLLSVIVAKHVSVSSSTLFRDELATASELVDTFFHAATFAESDHFRTGQLPMSHTQTY